MSYAILGYLMIALIVVLLLTNKATPITAFVIIPPIVALVAGYSIEEVNGFIQAGVSSSMGTALLALLSIIFFSIMTEQGLFDPFVNFLVSKAGNNVAVITVISAIVAHFSHLDTGTTSTLLVTIPSMLPIYRRLGIDRKYLYLVIVQAIGVMNLLPWGGAITRSCAVTGMDPATITVAVAPCLVAGFAYNMVTAWIYGQAGPEENRRWHSGYRRGRGQRRCGPGGGGEPGHQAEPEVLDQPGLDPDHRRYAVLGHRNFWLHHLLHCGGGCPSHQLSLGKRVECDH